MFGLSLGNLWVHLGMDASQYEAQMKKFEKSLQTSARRMESFGRSMTMKVTAPIIGLGAAGVASFAKFDDAMTKSTAIMMDITPRMRKEMEKTARQISGNSVKSATELAKAYFYLASAGLNAQQSLEALPVVEAFAVAGAFDMSRATDLLTDAQSALGLTVKDSAQNMKNMTKVGDALIAANTLANATTEQFSAALTTEAGAAMKQYNIDLNEGVSILAAYADQGIKAEHAGSLFGRMLRLTIKGFNDNRQAWRQFGVTIEDTEKKRLRPLADIIREMTVRLKDLSPTQKAATLEMLGFQARSQQAILPLLGLGDRIAEYQEKLEGLQGVMAKLRELQMQSFLSKMKAVWNQVVNMAESIGRLLAPRVEKFGTLLSWITEQWEKMSEPTQRLIVDMALLAASIGPMALVMSKLTLGAFALAKGLMASAGAAGILQVTLGSVVAAIAGYKIGTYLEDQFKWISFAGTFAIELIMKSWLSMKYTFQSVILHIKISWGKFVAWLKDTTADAILKISDGLERLEKVTGKDLGHGPLLIMAHGMKQEAASAKAQVEDVTKDLENMKKDMEEQVSTYSKAFDEAYIEIDQKFLNKKNQQSKMEVPQLVGVKEALEKQRKALEDQLRLMAEQGKILSDNQQAVQDMLDTLDAEKELIGKTNDERKRAVKLIEFKKAVSKLYAEDTKEYYDMVTQYEQKLLEIGELQRKADRWESLKRWAEEAADVYGNMMDLAAQTLENLSDELTDFFMTGQANWREFGRVALRELTKIFIKMAMIKMLEGAMGAGSWLGSLMGKGGTQQVGVPMGTYQNTTYAALGRAFSQGRVVPMALGGIFDSPAFVPMANDRYAHVAEKKPEAFVPLERNSQGKLSVNTTGANPPPVVNVKNYNIFDKSEIVGAMDSREGEHVILNVLKRTGVI